MRSQGIMRETELASDTELLCAKKARKALRVIPRGKHRLTVYRAHQVEFKHACQQVVKIDHKNEDISESVSSIDSGAIFLPRLAHELSRNVPVVSVYAL